MNNHVAKDDRINSYFVLLMRSTIPYSCELERLVSRRRRSQIFGSTLMRRLKSDHSSEVSAIVCQLGRANSRLDQDFKFGDSLKLIPRFGDRKSVV